MASSRIDRYTIDSNPSNHGWIHPEKTRCKRCSSILRKLMARRRELRSCRTFVAGLAKCGNSLYLLLMLIHARPCQARFCNSTRHERRKPELWEPAQRSAETLSLNTRREASLFHGAACGRVTRREARTSGAESPSQRAAFYAGLEACSTRLLLTLLFVLRPLVGFLEILACFFKGGEGVVVGLDGLPVFADSALALAGNVEDLA